MSHIPSLPEAERAPLLITAWGCGWDACFCGAAGHCTTGLGLELGSLYTWGRGVKAGSCLYPQVLSFGLSHRSLATRSGKVRPTVVVQRALVPLPCRVQGSWYPYKTMEVFKAGLGGSWSNVV